MQSYGVRSWAVLLEGRRRASRGIPRPCPVCSATLALPATTQLPWPAMAGVLGRCGPPAEVSLQQAPAPKPCFATKTGSNAGDAPREHAHLGPLQTIESSVMALWMSAVWKGADHIHWMGKWDHSAAGCHGWHNTDSSASEATTEMSHSHDYVLAAGYHRYASLWCAPKQQHCFVS